MGVWNDCCGNEKRKLMKTSSSIADLRPQAQSDSTAALSCTPRGDRPCLRGCTPHSACSAPIAAPVAAASSAAVPVLYAQLRAILAQSVQLAVL